MTQPNPIWSELQRQLNADSVLPAMHCFIRTASSLNMFPLVAQIPNSSPSLRRFLGLCLAHGALGSNPHSHLTRLLTSEIGPDPIVRLRELIGL